ncbi:MAG: prolyl oligopeptidase family serine peptidase [Pirellulaceae bacterium]|nr:prolyl oligopeptidase family serine peptidase [Pirellulaceae bacterium]
MAIEVSCRCGRRFAAKPELAGQRVKCPACGAGLVIPRPAAAPLVVACACGKRFEAQPHLAGRQVPCPSCRRPLLIPDAGGAASQAAATQSGFDFDLAAYEASAPAAPRPSSSSNPYRWADAAPLAKARVTPRKSNGINPRVFVIGGVITGAALVLVVGIVLVVQAVRGVVRGVTTRLVGDELPLQQEDYAQFRQTFRTQLVRRGPSPQQGELLGFYEGVDRIAYHSGGLNLTAYVDRAPADGRPRPAVLYLHGGFAFGEEDLAQAQPYRDAGFIVMVPVLRGENGQPGHFTLSYDEVDDVLGAADALAALPYVDAQQICVAGHSAGGTLAMLAALASPRFRASANFSGTANEKMICDEMPELVVYNQSDPREMLARSAEAFATSFKCPARLYYGNREWYFKPQLDRTAQRAKEKGIDVQVVQVPGDHFTMLEAAIPQSIQFFRSQMQTGPRLTPDVPLAFEPPRAPPSATTPMPNPATPGGSSGPPAPPWTSPGPPSSRPGFPSPPEWPGTMPQPPGGLPVPPSAATPGRAVQPPMVAFEMLGYHGAGDPTAAARRALIGIPWADVSRLHVDLTNRQILIGVRSSSLSTGAAKTALEQVGFQIGGVSYRPS